MGNAFLNSESSHFSDIQAFNLILLGILYLTVRILSGLSQYIQLTVVLGLLFYFLGEAIAGFGQIHDFVAPRHLIAQMSGSFQNSESYDGLLACLLPLSLSLALRANDAPSKRYLVVPVLSEHRSPGEPGKEITGADKPKDRHSFQNFGNCRSSEL